MTMANNLGDDDVDPARSDVPTAKRRRRSRGKVPMPEPMLEWAAAATERGKKRPMSPGVMVDVKEGVPSVTPIHQDQAAWEDMLADAFGTRSLGVMKTFMAHLAGLARQTYDHGAQAWKPSERELNAALAIVNASRPATELEAMQVAQMVAVHWMQMQVSAHALGNYGTWIDPKDVASVSMLARTFSAQADALRRSKQKPRKTVRQKIEVHHHNHQHIHMEGGGRQTGSQPHASGEEADVGKSIARAAITAGGAEVPGEGENNGRVVPLRRDEGEAGLSHARRFKPGRAEG